MKRKTRRKEKKERKTGKCIQTDVRQTVQGMNTCINKRQTKLNSKKREGKIRILTVSARTAWVGPSSVVTICRLFSRQYGLSINVLTPRHSTPLSTSNRGLTINQICDPAKQALSSQKRTQHFRNVNRNGTGC